MNYGLFYLNFWQKIKNERCKYVVESLKTKGIVCPNGTDDSTTYLHENLNKKKYMKKFTALLFILFCAFQTVAQTQNQFIDTRCKEIADAKNRAKMELERLEREEKALQGQKIELRLKQFNDELIALEVAENVEMNRIKERYLRLKGEIKAKMDASVIVSPQICN